MKKSGLLMIVTCLMLSVNAAEARNVWRSCGIGAMIFTKTGWAAITSNIIWDLGTTATSSNVSSDDLCEGAAANTAEFVNESYANLEEETAKGEGEHLTAMLNMLGCDAKAHPAIISNVRSDLQTQISGSNYSKSSRSENAERYFNTVIDEVTQKHASECKSI